jgi:hypothetical protein
MADGHQAGSSDQRRADRKNCHWHGLSVGPVSSFAFVPQALSNCVWETVAPVRVAPVRLGAAEVGLGQNGAAEVGFDQDGAAEGGFGNVRPG